MASSSSEDAFALDLLASLDSSHLRGSDGSVVVWSASMIAALRR